MIKSRRLRWGGHVARMEEDRTAFKILTDKPAEKSPLGRPRRRWEDNIRMDLKEIDICTRNWILTGKSTGKSPLGRPRRRWEDNIRILKKYVSIRGIWLIRLRIEIIGGPF